MLRGPCVVLSWNPEDPGYIFPESEDLEIHPSESHVLWMLFFINGRLYGFSSRNPEAGWTFVLEPVGWTDFRPGTWRLDGLSSWNPEAGWTCVLEPGGWLNFCPKPDGCVDLQGDLLVYLFYWKSPPSSRLKDGTRRVRFVTWSIGMHHIPPSVERKSLTGLEGAGVGVMTQVSGFAAFHVWGSRGWMQRSEPELLSIGTWRPSTEVAHSQQASPGQDIAPVMLLSQFSLVGARPDGETLDASVGINTGLSVAGPSGLGVNRTEIQDPGLACRWMARIVGFAGKDHLYQLKSADLRAHSHLFPRSEWHMTRARKQIIDLLLAYVPHDWISAGE
ncbi:hypothetical protein YC2023_051212 [Brassica napus]